MEHETHHKAPDGILARGFVAMQRHRKLALAAFLVPLLVSIALVRFGPRVYQSRAAFSLGNLGITSDKRTILPRPEEFVARMRERFFLAWSPSHALPWLSSIAVSQKDANVVTLVALGSTPEEAKEFLTRIAHEELSQLRTKLDLEVAEYKKFVGARRATQQMLQKEVAQLSAMQTGMNSDQAVVAQLIAAERGRLLTRIDEMDIEIFRTQLDLRLLHADEVKLVLDPTLALAPLRPQPLRYIGLGVMIGCLLAFFLPLTWQRFREARQQVGDVRYLRAL